MKTMMSFVFLCVSALTPALAGAAEFLPTEVNLCEDVACTMQMLKIQKSYNDNQHFAVNPAETTAYSGSCVHIHPDLDANREHHALVLFEPQKNEVLGYRGISVFYQSADPFAGFTLDQAREYLNDRGIEANPMRLEPGQARVTLPVPGRGVIDYWFRTTEDGSELYFLARWQLTQEKKFVTFCRLQRH